MKGLKQNDVTRAETGPKPTTPHGELIQSQTEKCSLSSESHRMLTEGLSDSVVGVSLKSLPCWSYTLPINVLFLLFCIRTKSEFLQEGGGEWAEQRQSSVESALMFFCHLSLCRFLQNYCEDLPQPSGIDLNWFEWIGFELGWLSLF